MASTRIWCCGADVWTKVIAWFQIVCCGIVHMIVAVRMVPFWHIGCCSTETAGTMTVLVTTLLFTIIGYAISIVLIHGSYNARPKLIGYWVNYSYFAIAFGIFLLVADSCLPERNIVDFAAHLVLIVVCVPVQGLSIWLVRQHKKDMEEKSIGTLQSVATSRGVGRTSCDTYL